MSEEKRLEELQAALVSRGVRDVKFFIRNVAEVPPSRLAADVAVALNALAAGQVTYKAGLGDSVRQISTI